MSEGKLKVVEYKPGPTSLRFHESAAPVRGIMGPVGCLPGDSEFLTPSGWVRMDAYKPGMKVATWANGCVYFDEVEYVNLPCDEMIRFDSGSLVMELSPEHRVPHYQFDGQFKVKTAAEIEHRPSKRHIPTTFELSRPDAPISDNKIRFMVMFSADGHIHDRGYQANITVRKQRKVDRLRWLLKECGITFKDKVYVRDGVDEYVFTISKIGLVKDLDFVWSLSTRQLGVVLEEAMHWDGLFNHQEKRYFSTVKKNADAIQFAAHASGLRSIIRKESYVQENWKDCYIVSIVASASSRRNAVSIREHTAISRFRPDDGRKYCFTTRTGFFIARCRDTVFVTGNSGKSSTCIMEIMLTGMRQKKVDGVRKSKVLVVRSTYPQLVATTIPDWKQWVDPEQFPVIMSSPMRCHVKQRLSDGSWMDMEVEFLALDEITDDEKLKSYNITFAWVNEASGIQHYHLISTLLSRCGRYPHKRDGGPTWAGLLMDTNPPSDRHWWHEKFEVEKPPGWEHFRQPGAVIWDASNDKWVLNDGDEAPAENIDNLGMGWEYYRRLINGNDDQWIRVFLAGEYGANIAGKPVYPSFKDTVHVSNLVLTPDRNLQVIFAFDWGLNPALSVQQVNQMGQLVILDELDPEDIDLETFMEEHVVPLRANRYQGCRIIGVGDPAGRGRSGLDKRTPFIVVKSYGIECVPAVDNDSVVTRTDCLKSFLARRNGLLISSQCKTHIQGFRGSYHFKIGNTADVESQQPVKNHHSHTMNACEYGAMFIKFHDGGTVKRVAVKPKKKRNFV